MRFTSFISTPVLRPSTFETSLRTSNSTGQNLSLYSHSKVALPRELSRCPPNATSLALDLVNGCRLMCMVVGHG